MLSDARVLPGTFDAPAPEQPIETAISMADDVFIKQVVIPKAGTFVPQHSHAFDHTSLLAVGAMRVWIDGAWLGDFQAPTPITIKAGAKHTMRALTDGTTFYCIHNTMRAGYVEETERHALPTEASPAPREGSAVFAVEPFETFWLEGQGLIAQHMEEVGERPGVPFRLNETLMRQVDAAGGAHVVTARHGGRLVGYLATIVASSLEDQEMLVGTQTAFFVAPEFRGVGGRMQRFSIESLRARGVGEVVLRAGTRGHGPRLAALFRRLGAVPHGELFSLMLREG